MNSAQDHPKRAQLIAFMSGQLSEGERASLAAHVEACDACCQMLREIPDDAFVVRIREVNTPGDLDVDEAALLPRRDRPLPKELSEHPRYKVGRFLGSGGMGAVYQAEHRLMGRTVALKIIHPELIRHQRVVERFRQEVKAAARLAHPNIVAAYDAEQAGDVHFLVMEFVDGISLAQLIDKKGPLEVATVCNFARQAARGLQHAFEAGMVHRDIKPHNLMLTRKGQIKILDFGLARLASENRADMGLPLGDDGPGLTRLGDIMGTPDFMAPEQVLDPSQADIRADMYGLACTMYYLLTGQTPFCKESGPRVRISAQYRVPRPITELRSDLPPDLVTVLNRMLAKAPAQRYQTPAEVLKALAGFIKPPAAVQSVAEVKPAPVDDVPRGPVSGFPAQCPFCSARIRVPDKALGASIPCPHCGSYFTVVPLDEGKRRN